MRRLLPLALAGLLTLTLVPGLAMIEATDWREARDAVVGRESAASREWLAPLYAGEPFFEKPIAGYAHELLARVVVKRWLPGATDLTVTAVSRGVRAALAAALALLVVSIGTRCFGARAGWLAGCALASMLGLPLAARSDGTQLLAALCAWAAVGWLLAVRMHHTPAPVVTRAAAYTMLGAAVMTGGPLSALWPLLGFALYGALARRHDGWAGLRPLAGLLIVLGIALPWYGMLTALYSTEFLSLAPGFPYAAESRGAWWSGGLIALSATVVLAFPWTALLGPALGDAARRLRRARRGPADAGDGPEHVSHLLVALLLAAALPVALYPGPPLTAALPALPAMALICGRFLDRVLDGDIEPAALSGAARLLAFLGVAVAGMAVALSTRLPEAALSLRLVGIALLVGATAPLLADLRGARRLAAGLFALPVALATPILMTRVLPDLEQWLNARAACEAMEAVAPAWAPLVLPEEPRPSVRLLLPRNLVVDPGLKSLREHAARDGRTYLAFRPLREREVARTVGEPLEILLRSPVLVLARVRVAEAVTRPATTTSVSGR